MRDRVRVTGLLTGDDGAVSGIEAQDDDGRAVSEEARVVIGADGIHSFVAGETSPATYMEVPPLLCSYYSYWSGVETNGVETYFQPGAAILVFPTHDDQVNIGAAWPVARFAEVRKNVEAVFLDTLRELAPELSERAAAGERQEPFRGIGELPFYRRQPYGPGWALIGDAGALIDSTLGLGMTKAFTEVDQMAIALDIALSGEQPFAEIMRQYQEAQDQGQDLFRQENLTASRYIAGVSD